MEKPQQKTTLILKYARRRFDGGPEIEMIRNIERQQQNEQLSRMYSSQQGMNPAMGNAGPVPPATVSKSDKDQIPDALKTNPVCDAILLGPLEVAVGLIGMLTASLAIVTFRQARNEAMLAQSKQVFADCVKTLRKGLWDSAMTPVRVFKANKKG